MGAGQSQEELKAHRDSVSFIINGKQYTIGPNHDTFVPDTRLVDYIRDNACLKGTKYMCREGGCGICTVMVTTRDIHTGKEIIRAVNSCLVPLMSCDGWEITTVEHVGNPKDGLHPIQQRFVKFHGTQCGYCTPGWIMNAYSLTKASKQKLTVADIENCTDGNYCRCTGYRPIVDSLRSLAHDADEDLIKQTQSMDLEAACKNSKCCKATGCEKDTHKVDQFDCVHMTFKHGEKWFKVNDITSLFLTMQQLKEAGMKFRVVAGNTGTGVYKWDGPYQAFVDINSVAALQKIQFTQASLILGGAITISNALDLLEQHSSMEGFEYFKMVHKHWKRVAHPAVRNIGTLGGNLMLKHSHPEFSSDLFLVLETIGAMLTIASSVALQEMHTPQEFLKLEMDGKIIYSVHIPKIPNANFHSFKIAKRYQNAHAVVNAGFLFDVDMSTFSVRSKPSIVFGGISPEFVRASKTEDYLTGKTLNNDTIQGAVAMLDAEIQPTMTPPDAHPEYRKALAQATFYKALLRIMGNEVNPKFASAASNIEKRLTHAKRDYKFPDNEYPIYQAVPKLEAPLQVSGTAEYTNDIPTCDREVHGAVVITSVSKAMLKTVDTAEAMKYPGVVGWADHSDIPGVSNYMKGLDLEPDPIFVENNKVRYAGEPIGVILAETRHAALAAVKLVKVEYEVQDKPVIDIPSALAKAAKEGTLDTFAKETFESKIKSGLKAPHTIKGEFKVGSQIHMPTEPTICLCIPRDDSMDVHCSTQFVRHVQNAVATALGWSCNAVNVFIRRMGGTFGIKIARSAHLATICAVAAHKYRRPVRMYQDMETYIKMHGKRQPHMFSYEVGFDENGKILRMNQNYFDDVGVTASEDTGFLAMWGFQSCYKAVGWKATKNIVKTDLAPNTFCRAPGLMKSTACIETIMDQIAWYLKKDPMEVRINNFIQKGDLRFPQNDEVLSENTIPNHLKEMSASAEIGARQQFVEKFNAGNRWKKRALAIMPARTPVHYLFSDYKVRIAVYGHDGSVAVCHSGVEMGQGINTKVAQVVARGLGVPLEKVKNKPGDSIRCANATLSGISITSEHMCHAAWKACNELNERLSTVKSKVENPTWENVVAYCKGAGMDLTAYGCTTYEDGLKTYDLYNLSIAEVEIDCLTGEYKIIRVDLKADIGYAISPDVDIGQIEGAFIMGLGFFLQEKVEYNGKTGELLTDRTWSYKPPFAKDIPEDFRLSLVRNNPNPYGVLRSKTTGEPPLMLSFSVVLALRRAIMAARMDAGNTDWFNMDPPITPEVVQRLCLSDPKKFMV